VDRSITVTATASKAGYTDASATSSPVTVAAGNSSIASVAINGTVEGLQTVTADVGAVVPSNAQLGYEWKIGGTTVGTGSSYQLQLADVGQSLTLTVTATRFGYQTATTSTSAVTVAPVAATLASVEISGKVKVGSTVTAEVGAVEPSDAVLSYDWQVGGSSVGTGPSYTIQPGDDGGSLTVTVTATKPGYSVPVVTSAARIVGATDFTDLQATVDNAVVLDPNDFTTTSWADFTASSALSDAQTVLGNPAATQQQVDDAQAALENAIAALVPRGDPGGLQNVVNEVGTLVSDPSKYTDASAQAFADALADAQAVLADAADKSQAQLDAAAQALLTAAGGLRVKPVVPVVSKDVLQSIIGVADTKKQADYSAGWSQLVSALTAAKGVYANASATQAQVDKAAADLVKAVGALVVKPAPPVVVETETNVDSGKQVVATKVKFGQSGVTLAKGKTFWLHAAVYYTKGTPAYSSGVSYKSSNPKVVTVDKYGRVKALKAGIAKIVATTKVKNAKGKYLSTSYTVKVVKKKSSTKVSKVSLSVPKTMKVGQVAWVTGKYSNARAQAVRISYSSKAYRVVTIDAAGRLVALSKGKDVVTIKAGNKTKKYTVTVK
jgi:hypothetical protein